MDIERLRQAVTDKRFILSVNPDWRAGRSRGLSDDETEQKANDALTIILENIEELVVASLIDARQSVKSGETTSCEWCEPKTIPLFYAECVRATIDDESQLISVSYCPNCGRKIGEATEEIIVPAMTAEEENILREIAAWFPQSDRDPRQSCSKRLFMTHGDIYLGGDVSTFMPFGDKTYNSKAYEVLAPILEKYGEINLDEYRGAEEDEPPFGSCDFCGYEFNSELINEYEITHCPKCGEEIEESIDLGW